MSVPTLVIPGLLCDARLFAAQMPALRRHGEVLFAEHRRQASIAQIASDALDAAPERFNLIGLSMGGYVAFEILRRAPERVVRLALLVTTAAPDGPEQKRGREALIERAEAGRFDEVVETLSRRFVTEESLARPEIRATIAAMAEATGPDAFVRQQRAIMARPDSRPDLARIPCPTLVMAGEMDALMLRSAGEEMAERIPNAGLAQLRGCGHLPPLERPEETARLLDGWLGGALP